MTARERTPSKMDKRLNVYLDEDTLKQVAAIGVLRNRSNSGVARELIEERIAELSGVTEQREKVPA